MNKESAFALSEEIVDQASRKLGEAQQLEILIERIEEKGLSFGVYNSSTRFSDQLKPETTEIIKTIIISELNAKMNIAANQLQNILGGKENGESE